MPIVIPLFYVSIGIIIFNIVQSAAIGISGHRRLLYFTLSACGMVFVVFQYSVVRLYLAESISEASSALRWQMGAATLFMPLFYCVISAYTEQQRLNPGLTILALIYALLFLLNLNSPYSLRYDSLQSAEPLVLPWGEQLAFYSGELSTKNILARLVNTAVNLYLFVPMLKMYKQGRRRAALVLVICNILFILTSGLGALIDAGTIKFIYGVGFTYLIFAALITMSLGMDIRENNIRISLTSKQLQHEVEQREEIEYAIRQIAHSASSQIGENYFRRLVSILADLFDSQHALIGTYNEKEGTITTLALLHNGKLVNNISFAVNGSPAAHVLEYGSFYSKNTMSRLFPKAKYLADLDVSSYLGVALKNNEGTKLGVLELLSSRPIFKAAMAEEIIGIISARTAAELERMRSEQMMRTMAYRDYLTGLTNRASLQQHLNAMIQKSMHMDLRGAMLMIDLDHFKTINDALSHDVGDEVLRHVAQRILDSTGAQGLAARLGGDEFVVVIDPIVTPLSVLQEKALDLANRISKALAKPIEIGEHALNIGASIGIATFPNRGENSLDLLRHADMALYQAKSKGRSNVQFYEAPMQTAAYNRLLIEKGLRKALESDQLSLNYQPQVNAAGDITGAEVLLRWKHPKLGNVPPSSFIPLAEETGLIHNIGNWVLHHVCQQILDWKNAGILLPGHFAINVSPWQFTRADFVSRIYSTFTVYGVSPALITLEITESALIYDIKEAIEKLKSLREIGLSISLDDFGTGYSSLSYLQQLPLDEIKIDQSFVRELSIHEHHPLMESMMAIGRHMHLKVVAEGVENGLQRDRLLAMGCEHFQGFWYSQPLADQAFQHWLKHTLKQEDATVGETNFG